MYYVQRILLVKFYVLTTIIKGYCSVGVPVFIKDVEWEVNFKYKYDILGKSYS